MGAATAYGSADFLGGFFSRRAGVWPVAVTAQLSAAASAAALAILLGSAPEARVLVWGCLGGVGSGIATGFLYRGMVRGRMAVVAPLSAVGATLLPVAVGVGGGERPSLVVWAACVLALPAIWLVTQGADDVASAGVSRADERGAGHEGALDGVISGAGAGLMFVALGQVTSEEAFTALAVAQSSAVPVLVVLAVFLRARWLPRAKQAWWGVVVGPTAALATGLFMWSAQTGLLTVASVISSLYPAVTIVLALALLREAVARRQWAGLLLCCVVIVGVAGG